MILGSDTVTRLRGRTRDGWGDIAGTDSELDISGCSVQPGGGQEQTDTGESVQSNFTVYMPAGTDILPDDRVRLADGSVYAVNGPPAAWHDQNAMGSHVQVQLVLKEGQA